ncbi:hypothetical protein SERLADRAFT_399765 [Serpula lacrymans var. lacrymans S7.9]|uniref:Integral membrane protein n=1 Tax=Serpula lacrymans var. lacrymans (strain S7.9) TaxID=578457 RepID=F8P8B1_SERL9|nr:uncharacterized protein SERLADRAFT_399765 [Serpula lacrymans var. lacrymans S7.9]EGO20667.1 hypothetical protein SERLADRAFT_399765 [Serpula lacrymans var. lacrymans S7.9]
MVNDITSTIRWPSLYNPGIEIINIAMSNPTRTGGYYLLREEDVFRFTLYWTLIFHLPFSLFCGIYAFLNFTLPPTSSPHPSPSHTGLESFPLIPTTPKPLSPLAMHPSPDMDTAMSTSPNIRPWSQPRMNVRRSRLTFALLVLFAFLFFSFVGAIISAAVVGFLIVGVYKSGEFYVSTWVPFIWAIIQGLISLLGIWPSVIDII